jgi:miniconductance mechanosensitive channel
MELPAGFPEWLDILIYGGIVLVAFLVVRWVVVPIIRRATRATPTQWDDVLADNRFVGRLSWILPMIVALFLTPILGVGTETEIWVERSVAVILVVVAVMTAHALLDAVSEMYAANAADPNRSIKGYLQAVRLFVWLVAGLVLVAVLTDTELTRLLAGLAALSAVLLLVFQTTILSIVASILLTSNDMVRLGDWITVPGTAADGDVIDIALHTVKVQNFDKTVSTIPTTRLVNESFVNWRGVAVAGGRRMKRHILVDQGTIRFLAPEEIERWSGFEPIVGYMAAKRAELEAQDGGDGTVEPDLRRLTNVGTFRAYAAAYLGSHPEVAADRFPVMVRQLQPTPDGLPLEVYAFTATTDWMRYEAVQSDIFDHLIATLPEFGLAVAQRPTGGDVGAALSG